MKVPVYFHPATAGVYEADLVFDTNAGNIVVKCRGEALSTDGTLLLEDFEDDAANWFAIDGDKDGLTWDLGSNLLGGQEELYVHSGRQALVSMSYNYSLGGLTPDNWAISPEFTIPATSTEDVTLSWWVGLQVAGEYVGDNYTVYITDKELPETFTEDDWIIIHNEIPENVDWEIREYDISEYAGKTCRLAFRHHDAFNKWMLKIDDVIVFDGTTSVNQIENANRTIISQEFYTIDGIKAEKPENGIYIVKTNYDDGSISAKKVIIKK